MIIAVEAEMDHDNAASQRMLMKCGFRPIPVYLDDVNGVYKTMQGFYVKDEDVDKFDKEFPLKEKLKLPGQIFE